MFSLIWAPHENSNTRAVWLQPTVPRFRESVADKMKSAYHYCRNKYFSFIVQVCGVIRPFESNSPSSTKHLQRAKVEAGDSLQ